MSLFVLWLGVMFPLVFSPGPANVVFAVSGAQVGVKRSVPLLAGVDCVFILKSLLVGYGLAELFLPYPNIMNALQLLGAFYLVYLGISFLPAAKKSAGRTFKPMGFVDGLILQSLNSKGWLMVFLMFSLFAEQALQSFGEQGTLMLVIWLAVLNISMHFVWIVAGGLLARVSDHPRYQTGLNGFYASCLFMVAIWMLVDKPLWLT